jgi:hypothetical protein
MAWQDLVYSIDMDCPVDSGHPQKVMRDLGITYRHAVPQSLYYSWWFLGCEGVPEELPAWIRRRDLAPYKELIGHGLGKQEAERLTALREEGR